MATQDNDRDRLAIAPAATIDRLPAAKAAELSGNVRELLDAGGHVDVAFDAEWLRLETQPGGKSRLVAKVPIGRGYILAVHGRDLDGSDFDGSAVEQFAAALAAALPNLRRGARSLVGYARSVGRATHAVCTKRRSNGQFLGSRSQTLAPIAAARLASAEWSAVIRDAKTVITVSGFNGDVEWSKQSVEVGKASEVAAALHPLFPYQAERRRLLDLSRAPGPRLLVDAVTVALISAAGYDPAKVLSQFMLTPQFDLDVEWNGKAGKIYLHSLGTRISSRMTFESGTHRTYWAGTSIGVEKSKRKAKAAKPGAPAAALIDHPAFRERLIVAVGPIDDQGSVRATLDEPILRFDANTRTFTPSDGTLV